MVANVLDDARIKDAVSKMACTSLCKDRNIDKIATVMTKRSLDSDEVL